MSEHVTVQIPKELNLIDGEFGEMNWKQFQDWSSGQLAISIGRGKFNETLWSVLDITIRKARTEYHKQLLESKK